MKYCSICRLKKTSNEYSLNNKSKDGLQAHCKECHNIMVRRWRAKNISLVREKARKAKKAYYKKYPKKLREQNKRMYALYGQIYKERLRIKNKEKREMVIEKYGGQCKCCGEKTIQFLAIDHINNDGKEHRKTVRSSELVSWIIKNNYPKNLQILCFNCNWAKSIHGKCPHKK